MIDLSIWRVLGLVYIKLQRWKIQIIVASSYSIFLGYLPLRLDPFINKNDTCITMISHNENKEWVFNKNSQSYPGYIWRGIITKASFHFTFKARVHFAHWTWDGKLSSNESFFAKKLILLFSSQWCDIWQLFYCFHECDVMECCLGYSCSLQRWRSDQWLTKFVIYYCITYAFYKFIKKVNFLNLVCVFHCKPIFVYVVHCRFI